MFCASGFLICYDNNLPENVRCTAMLGAEVIFMPHVTGCLPSVSPSHQPRVAPARAVSSAAVLISWVAPAPRQAC